MRAKALIEEGIRHDLFDKSVSKLYVSMYLCGPLNCAPTSGTKGQKFTLQFCC